MRKLLIVFITVNIIVTSFILFVNRQTIPTITYFPLHELVTFSDAKTELKAISIDQLKEFILDWTIFSQTKSPTYLRQDISLLYENGFLLGIINKWQTDTNKLKVKRQLEHLSNSFYQAISFHYGEIHEHDQTIKSTQKMTYDQLYVINCQTCHKLLSFQQALDQNEKLAKQNIHQQVLKQSNQFWQQLIEYFEIDKQNYYTFPLTKLAIYEHQPLPEMTQQETNIVLGQLWEGLYKNYVLPLSQTKISNTKNYIPLILIDKQKDHLMVLFELDGKPIQLIQKLPKSNL